MLSSNQFHQEFHVTAYTAPTNPVTPLMMTMCAPYQGANSNTGSCYGNQPSVAANSVVCQGPYGYHVPNFGPSSGVKPDDELAEVTFEVHDSFLKTPITVSPNAVYRSKGSHELFSNPHLGVGVGSRISVRVCEQFHEGCCYLGENCSDIHVVPSYLSEMRQQMINWLECKDRHFEQLLLFDPEKTFRVFCADLKEVVEVPISALRFTKGLYVDPSTRARRTRGSHHSHYSLMASQVPTACGLFATDPSQCKWGRWCNQVHIDAQWMQSKKKQFEDWSKKLEMYFNELPYSHVFDVHDPQLKMCLRLPKASIAAFSRGLFQGSPSKAPSVCMLFQRNRCTANTCCNQIHVVTPYLQLHRRWISNRDQLSEEERRQIWSEMQGILGSLSQKPQKEPVVGGDDAFQGKELNPQAQPYVPSPPQRDGVTVFVGETKEDVKGTRGGNKEECKNLSFGYQQQEAHGDDIAFQELAQLCTSAKSPDFKSTGAQQTADSAIKSTPITDVDNNGGASCGGRGVKSYIAGSVLPLGEFVNLENDERSQSSLQASQSNLSHAGRSCRHTNNPYAFSGSASCTASVNFGWLQPVRSGGNSCTTVVAGGGGGNGEARSKTESGLGTTDVRLAANGYLCHEFDATLRSSPHSFLNLSA